MPVHGFSCYFMFPPLFNDHIIFLKNLKGHNKNHIANLF